MSRKPFDKFINKVESGAKKKERIRQEKKKIRAEKNAYFDEQKKLARERRAGNKEQGAGYRGKGTGERVQVTGYKLQGTGKQGTGEQGKGRGLRVEGKKNETAQSNASGVRKAGSRDGGIKHKHGLKKEERPTTSSGGRHSGDKREHKGYRLQGTGYREEETGGSGRTSGKHHSVDKRENKEYRAQGREEKAEGRGQRTENRGQREEEREKSAGGKIQDTGYKGQGKGQRTEGRGERKEERGQRRDESMRGRARGMGKAQANQQTAGGPEISNAAMPLNKFIAWSGVCGRREAADLIKAGKVTVNNQLVTEPPFRVSQSDSIKVNGKKITIQKNLVYILLNKPKDYITTTDDPEGRKTVMDLVKRATTERVFPVGRLDRNTTGVLLLTNDGELAQRLTHPKYEVKKIYEVRVDKPVTKQQLDKIASGITLEDGFIQPDAIAYADSKDKSIVGIEIHSGRNRIVRRIFEHLGFKVKNLDRVMYGIFTKKNVDRGKWRLLTEKEIRLLKHLNTSFANKKSS
jgi:23S rRNA pseudouridine2605 synthase